MYCVKCGKEYEGQFCPHCGQAAPAKRYCPGCGAEITDPNITECPGCGGFVPKTETPPPYSRAAVHHHPEHQHKHQYQHGAGNGSQNT